MTSLALLTSPQSAPADRQKIPGKEGIYINAVPRTVQIFTAYAL